MKNLTGTPHLFGYLPPHGKRMGIASASRVPGNNIDRVLSAWPGSPGTRRFKSLERDLLRGRIAIEKTPPPIFFDAAAPSSIAAPSSAVTIATSGAVASTLPSGTYFFVATYLNAYGETTIGASRSAGQAVTNGTTKLQITHSCSYRLSLSQRIREHHFRRKSSCSMFWQPATRATTSLGPSRLRLRALRSARIRPESSRLFAHLRSTRLVEARWRQPGCWQLLLPVQLHQRRRRDNHLSRICVARSLCWQHSDDHPVRPLQVRRGSTFT